MPLTGGLILEDESQQVRPPTDYKLFLVQELCQASLVHVIESKTCIINQTEESLLASLGILLDVSSGMEYLHSKGIIHGDLKPENVLVKSDHLRQHGFITKITDFGLSMKLEQDKTHISNFRQGTPFYVAPEILSFGRTTPPSDVYSFGILCVEVTTGSQPWIVEKNDSFKANPHFFDGLKNTSPDFRRLAFACLQIDPKVRPSFAEITQSLQAMLDAEVTRLNALSSATDQEGKQSPGLLSPPATAAGDVANH